MAQKDPFESMPSIEPEAEPIHTTGFAEPRKETPDEVTASAPPRNLMTTAKTLAVPVFFGATLVWLFFTPDNPRAGKLVEAERVTVNAEQQAAETVSLYQKMQKDAAKPKPVVVPVMPGMPGSLPPAGQAGAGPTGANGATAPLPPNLTSPPRAGYTSAGAAAPSYGSPPAPSYPSQGYQTASNWLPPPMSEEAAREAQAKIAAQLKREEEIRSAPLEAGQIRLHSQGSSADGAKPLPALADLQADIAVEREQAMRAAQAMQERIVTSMAPKESPRSRGSNEDFLANAAGSASAQSAVPSLQAPVGRYLVGEGAVIRAVLLTNVNSDLPGRILARITSDVYDSTQRHVVIPKGSLINGVYNSQVIVGQERLLMAMTRLTLPNGNWIPLTGNGATDMMGTSGIDADVDNHFMKMFGSSLIVGASSLMLPRVDTSVTTLPGTTGTNGAATAGSVFATTLNDVLKTLLDRNKQIAPTLRNKELAQEFIFMVNQDMMMLPYR